MKQESSKGFHELVEDNYIIHKEENQSLGKLFWKNVTIWKNCVTQAGKKKNSSKTLTLSFLYRILTSPTKESMLVCGKEAALEKKTWDT